MQVIEARATRREINKKRVNTFKIWPIVKCVIAALERNVVGENIAVCRWRRAGAIENVVVEVRFAHIVLQYVAVVEENVVEKVVVLSVHTVGVAIENVVYHTPVGRGLKALIDVGSRTCKYIALNDPTGAYVCAAYHVLNHISSNVNVAHASCRYRDLHEVKTDNGRTCRSRSHRYIIDDGDIGILILRAMSRTDECQLFVNGKTSVIEVGAVDINGVASRGGSNRIGNVRELTRAVNVVANGMNRCV